jgi:hypothetical protein
MALRQARSHGGPFLPSSRIALAVIDGKHGYLVPIKAVKNAVRELLND